MTEMEATGLVDREQLLDIQGHAAVVSRSTPPSGESSTIRTPVAAGLLTEERFGDKLRDLLMYLLMPMSAIVELLKIGRQFRLSPRAKMVVGRNEADNEKVLSSPVLVTTFLRFRESPVPAALLSAIRMTRIWITAGLSSSYGKLQKASAVEIVVRRGKRLRGALSHRRRGIRLLL